MMDCQVCERRPGEQVCSSTFGAISFSYCGECLHRLTEPLWLVKSTLWNLGGSWKNAAAWVKEYTTFVDGHYVPVTWVRLSAAEKLKFKEDEAKLCEAR